MKHVFDGYNYFVRLEEGERLVESLEKFAKSTDIEGAWVSGIGKVSEVTLGFFDSKTKEYTWQTMSDPLEIVSLSGSLAFDESGKLAAHLHGTFGGAKFQTIGGHIQDFVTGATAELFIHKSHKPLKRVDQPGSVLRLLDLPDSEHD